ncbi:flagellar motor switch protein FliN [bacterium]|nr:flagellar motor switch protein FliN [bacterium]
MTEIGLTQEQIDAMLGGVDVGDGGGSGVSSDDLVSLADLERETMGNLPSIINAMTGMDYALGDIEFTRTNPEEILELIGDDLIFSIPISVGEPATHYIVIERTFAKQVAGALTGSELDDSTDLGEMEMSAIQEVVSQANGTYLTNLGAALKTTATGEALTAIEAAELGGNIDDSALLGTLSMQQSDGSTAQVRHLLPGSLGSMFLNKLRGSVAPEPAAAPAPGPAPQPAAAPMAAPAPAQPVSTGPIVSSGSIAAPSSEFQPATFSQLAPPIGGVDTRNLDILLDVTLQVTVELGKTLIPIRQILEYGQGSLITLDKLAGEPIDLLVNGKYFAKGEVVVIDENFGVRITSILSPAERIAQLS